MDSPVAVYVHTPFCPSKCGYCDFNSYAMEGDIIDQTVQATIREIESSPWIGRPAKTIFFGGGTPTYLSSHQLVSILEAVIKTHPPIQDCEITSEANPGTVDIPKFADMRAAGFNRISLGAQSFDTGDLHRLGRVHEASHIGRAVTSARKAGFEKLNLDLMFALPGQSMRGWKINLDLALQLQPDHLSLYGLTIEQNTRYYKLHLRGMLDLPEDEVQVAMYDHAVETCTAAGLAQYEISNFAKPGQECRHNLEYWYGNEYLAYGPGAVGCFSQPNGQKQRYTNLKHPRAYSESLEQSGSPSLIPSGSRRGFGGGSPATHPLWCEQETLDQPTQDFEKLMLGLRLNQGVPRLIPHDPKQAKILEDRGWIQTNPDRLVLTQKGRHFCSEATALLAP